MIGNAVNEPPPFTIGFKDSGRSFICLAISSSAITFAALSNNIHRPTVAQQVSINYLAAPKGKTLIAKAEIVKAGRTSTIIQVTVTDDEGRKVALFTGTGFKL